MRRRPAAASSAGASTAEALGAGARAVLAAGPRAPGGWKSYTQLVCSYASRAEAMQELGNVAFCRSHAARVVKTKQNGMCTLLRCRLADSTPPCAWGRMLRVCMDGSCELYRAPDGGAEHNSARFANTRPPILKQPR